MVVLPDGLIDGEHELAECRESRRVTEVHFELRKERFLIAVLPGTARCRTRDHGADCLHRFNIYASVVFTAVIAVEDSWSSIVMQSVHER